MGKPSIEQRIKQRAQQANVMKNAKQTWEEMLPLFDTCSTAVTYPMQQISELSKYTDILAHLPNHADFINNVNILKRDGQLLLNELAAIHEQHRDKKGDCTPEDIMLAMELSESYHTWTMRTEALIMPTVNYILADFALASSAFEAAKAALAAQATEAEAPVITGETIEGTATEVQEEAK